MKCDVCRGACCESFSIPAADIRPPSADARRWLELHATVQETLLSRDLSFEVRCTALTPAGKCGIYAERPEVCRAFAPGGQDCLATVRARRTPAQYQEIRDAADPLTLEVAV